MPHLLPRFLALHRLHIGISVRLSEFSAVRGRVRLRLKSHGGRQAEHRTGTYYYPVFHDGNLNDIEALYRLEDSITNEDIDAVIIGRLHQNTLVHCLTALSGMRE